MVMVRCRKSSSRGTKFDCTRGEKRKKNRSGDRPIHYSLKMPTATEIESIFAEAREKRSLKMKIRDFLKKIVTFRDFLMKIVTKSDFSRKK
jgi:hypothetical protein